MPIPVSRTRMTPVAVSGSSSSANTTRPPDSVNLAALPSRLPVACAIRRLVTLHPDRLTPDSYIERDSGVGEPGPVVVGCPTQQQRKVEPGTLQPQLPRDDPRHVEQIVNESGELRHLPCDHLPRAAGLLAAGSGTVEDEEAVGDRRQRIAKLVREHGQETGSSGCRLLGGPLPDHEGRPRPA